MSSFLPSKNTFLYRASKLLPQEAKQFLIISYIYKFLSPIFLSLSSFALFRYSSATTAEEVDTSPRTVRKRQRERLVITVVLRTMSRETAQSPAERTRYERGKGGNACYCSVAHVSRECSEHINGKGRIARGGIRRTEEGEIFWF
jgi:hypothetical protein